jgi:hypothetical protein
MVQSPTISSATPSTVTPSFRQNMKININDYPKLKEDSKWRVFQRQLTATAANHDTLEVLNAAYVPPPAAASVSDQKQKFMFNVFSQCINTKKGKVCVRAEVKTMDAQKAYAALMDAYSDQLSVHLDSTSLRSELTVMKLDD